MRHSNDDGAIELRTEPHSSLRLRLLTAAVVPSLLLLATSIALAEAAPAKLPADGWWVRYFITMHREGTNETSIMKRTYSLVGTTTENGEPCRWVEMKTHHTHNGGEFTEILKFLVPEKELLENEKPLDRLVRAWRKFNDEPAEEQKFNQPLGIRGSVASADYVWGRDLFILPGPQRETKAVNEKRVVEFQQGRLELGQGREGKHVATRQALTVSQKQMIQREFTVWNHPSVTLGFVAAKSRTQVLLDDVPNRTFNEEWVIEDFGTDAKSAIPENN